MCWWWLQEFLFQLTLNLMPLNILGQTLRVCCVNPRTGYLRDGLCCACSGDVGNHIVCAVMTEKFLNFSRQRGNDLVTPSPENDFPGLKVGDRWCLCLGRWMEAYEAGVAPDIVPEATHVGVTEHVDLAVLNAYSC